MDKVITTDKCWVGQEHLLIPGTQIRWLGANGDMIRAEIVERLPGIAFRIKDAENGRISHIYIERIKEVIVREDDGQDT